MLAQQDAYRNAKKADVFDVPPVNWKPLMVFLGVQTQWRMGGMGGFLGLDYSGVDAYLRVQRVKDRQEVFADLMAMESAALEILNRGNENAGQSS